MSEDTNMGIVESEESLYKRKYLLLLKTCEAIQDDNERLVNRLQTVRRYCNERRKHVKSLQTRLDQYRDDWRNIKEIDTKPDIKPDISSTTNLEKENDKLKNIKKVKKRKTTRSEKTEKDPNAPKRPANPFFQFCQEQRQVLMEQINSELKPGEAEPSKQELTRQLAVKWKSLSGEDKQVYVDMYERSKEKYAVELSAYNCI